MNHAPAFVHVLRVVFVVGSGTVEVQWVCRIQFPVVLEPELVPLVCDMACGIVSHSLGRVEELPS